jgi:hypothetical protein
MLGRSDWRKQKVWVVVAAVEEQMGRQSSSRRMHQPYLQTKMSIRQGIALVERRCHQKRSKKTEVAALGQAWVQMRTKTE